MRLINSIRGFSGGRTLGRLAGLTVTMSLAGGFTAAAANAQLITVNFDNIMTPTGGDPSHPGEGNVGPATPAYTENGFSLLRIPNSDDPSSVADHFHPVQGLGSAGNPYTTAAEFFSDDGTPFLYFDGPILGTSDLNYTPGTESVFSLVSFDILNLDGSFELTSSSGATLAIDHVGIYDLSDNAGFQNITSFQHAYTGVTDGDMSIDNIIVNVATSGAAAAPEPDAATLLAAGLTSAASFVTVARLRRRAKG